ncbi:ATP-binding protein [Nocardia vulneris]|uniref:ATP-binding protein n=1 Tax=Nocardia vulneris TaxID=1141657 RepID=UPI0005BAE6A5|nr:ATP-binding protein [Nocardia vulneris]
MTSLRQALRYRASALLPNCWRQRTAPARAAGERVDRIIAFALGAGTWIFGIGDAAEIAEQSRHYAPWWTVVAMCGVFGTALVLAATTLFVPFPAVRVLAATHATVFAVVIGLSGFAVTSGQITNDVEWIYRLVPLGGVAATVVWRTPVTALYLLVVAVLAAWSNGQVKNDLGSIEFFLTWLRIFGISVGFVYITRMTRRAAQLLDLERTRAQQQATLAAAAEARAGERALFAGVIHDKVLATLLDTSRGGCPTMLARQAEQALGQFAAIGRINELCTGAEAIETITTEVTTATETSLRVQVRHDRRASELRIDSAAVSALAQAAAEAVRNSVRHADVPERTITRDVTIAARECGLTVVVADDGAGFDPAAVAPNRLGLTVSIVQRMREVGGRAVIDAAPGAGTRIILEWDAPDDA